MNLRTTRELLLTLLLATAAPISQADHDGHARLSIADARAVMAVALEEARRLEAPGAAIAIVDAGGLLVLLERLDGTFGAAAEISEGKARTAALFKRPTRDFERIVNEGRTTMVSLSAIVGFTPLQGGVPLIAHGEVVGAIGVSGASSAQQDDDIAQVAGERFARGIVSATVHVPGREVAGAFKRGAALHETADYKIHASRRDGAGDAEIHTADTDIFYVLDGRARFVTGGRLVDGMEAGQGEIRGPRIDGGDERDLQRGDVIVVPRGVPHWFKSVTDPVTYLVVKSSR